MVGSQVQREIVEEIEGSRERWVSFLADLVATPSVNPPGDYAAVQSMLEDRFASLGWDHRTVEAPEELLKRLGLSYPRPNVLASPVAIDGPTLGLVAHLDTVPADASQWSFDPFDPVVENGRLYGRGAKDCKGRIVAYTAAVESLRRIDRLPERLGLIVAATADEETGSAAGARYLAESGEFRPTFAVVEGNIDRLWYATAGILQYEVTIIGKSAHAGLNPEEGHNPILQIERVLEAVAAVAEDYQGITVDVEGVDHPRCNPTMVEAGIKANVIPATCTLTVDVRVPPGVPPSELEGRFMDLLGDVRLPESYDLRIERSYEIDAYTGSREGQLLEVVRDNARSVAGRDLPIEGVMGPTDAVWFGREGCECVHYGPGDASSNQHGPDENVRIDQLVESATVLACAIIDLNDRLG